jgi:broad specificity phosphatase PhoE
MAKTTTILLVRHTQVHNPKQFVYFRTPRMRLSPQGLVQAETTARFLRRESLAAIYSSPMLRARQTAQILQKFHPTVPIHQSAFLNEVRSSYQGASYAELEKMRWAFYDHRKSEKDERREDILARFMRQLDLTMRRHSGEQVVWVSHGDPILLMTLWAEGLPLEEINRRRRTHYISHGSVTKLKIDNRTRLPIGIRIFEPNL